MIQVALEKSNFYAGQSNKLTITLVNTEQEILTNIGFGLKLPPSVSVQSGSKQVAITKLTPGEKFQHTLQIKSQYVGTYPVTIFNFSYRDGAGKTQRLKECSNQIIVQDALPLPTEAKIDVKLYPTELQYQEWGLLKGRITNIGQIAIGNIKIRATNRVEFLEDVSLGVLRTNEIGEFSLRLRPFESGSHVPISIEVSYVDQVKRSYNHTSILSLKVTRKEQAASPVFNIHGSVASVVTGGEVTYQDKVVGSEHNYPPEQRQNLATAAAEIQQLLNQLSQTNPTNREALEAAVYQEIQHNPTLKARLKSALKAGGLEALKAIFNHPAFSIPLETIKGWLEVE